MTPAHLNLMLSIADDDFILGYRDSEWTGIGPLIEEDIAMSSIAQDEIGHARALYELIEQRTGQSADDIALGRSPSEYRHCALVEHPREDWAFSIVRQYLYDAAEEVRAETLLHSSDSDLAGIFKKIVREEKYHRLHGHTWMVRLAHGGTVSKNHLLRALQRAIPLALGFFEPLPNEKELVETGILPKSTDEMRSVFIERIEGELRDQGIDIDVSGSQPTVGGRTGHHTTAFSTLWAEMTLVYRQDPQAVW
ncbi:MAG: 1,2-phenylacetyl-CoA epoxidase subunit PaaC [Deinococcaceae bacterium]